jgi:hypothetical protein
MGDIKITLLHLIVEWAILKMAQPTRLELATSCVTGRRSNQLNYGCTIMVGITGLEPVTSTL